MTGGRTWATDETDGGLVRMELVWLPRHGSDLRTDAHTKKGVRICAGGMASEHKKDERSEESGRGLLNPMQPQKGKSATP